MDNYPLDYQPWSDRLAMDVALMLEDSGETVDEVVDRHHIGPDDLVRFSKDPLFLRKVGDLRSEVRDKGVTFRLKARAQAEELLKTSWGLIHAVDVSAAVKADLIKATVKWGGLEPTKESVFTEGGAGGVSITINLDTQTAAVTATPRTIEHEANP